jgi:hypothetical protein
MVDLILRASIAFGYLLIAMVLVIWLGEAIERHKR